MTNIVLDGHIADKFTFNTNSKAVALTTAQSKGVVIIWVSTEQSAGGVTVSSIASANLSFTHRKSASFLDTNTVTLEEWYAPYNAALSAESITVTLSGNCDGATIIAAGFSDGISTIGFDTNAGLAASATSTSLAACQVTGVNSDHLGTTIAAWATTFANDGNGALPGTGFTSVDVFNDSNAGLNNFIEAQYEAGVGPLSSATVAFNRATERFVIVADVLVAETSSSAADALSSDAHLSDMQLSDRNLSDRHLSDAHLSDAHLSDAHLSDRQLSDRLLSDRNRSDALLVSDALASDKILADALSSDHGDGALSSDAAVSSNRLQHERDSSDKIVADALSSDNKPAHDALSSEQVSSERQSDLKDEIPPPIQTVVTLSS